MAKKDTLESLATLVTKGFKDMRTGFAKQEKEISDLTDTVAFVVKNMANLATKDDIERVQTQVNSIEQQVRTLVHMEVRVADLEDEVFGSTRRKARI